MKSIQTVANAHTRWEPLLLTRFRAGRIADAEQAAVRLLKRQPDFRASHARDAFPIRSPDERERIASALREPGLPD
jgi:hypothetical protein